MTHRFCLYPECSQVMDNTTKVNKFCQSSPVASLEQWRLPYHKPKKWAHYVLAWHLLPEKRTMRCRKYLDHLAKKIENKSTRLLSFEKIVLKLRLLTADGAINCLHSPSYLWGLIFTGVRAILKICKKYVYYNYYNYNCLYEILIKCV